MIRILCERWGHCCECNYDKDKINIDRIQMKHILLQKHLQHTEIYSSFERAVPAHTETLVDFFLSNI